MSGAVPYGLRSGCTGAPGHLVAGRCTVDGSNESHWWFAAADAALLNCPIIFDQDHNRSGPFEAYLSVILRNDLSERSIAMTQETVQLVAGALAVLLVGIIILRRKNKKKQQEDEF